MAELSNDKCVFYVKNDICSFRNARTTEGHPVYPLNHIRFGDVDVKGYGGKHDGERRIMGDQPCVYHGGSDAYAENNIMIL